jgi:hypothetical protein
MTQILVPNADVVMVDDAVPEVPKGKDTLGTYQPGTATAYITIKFPSVALEAAEYHRFFTSIQGLRVQADDLPVDADDEL